MSAVAPVLGVDVSTLRLWIRTGQFPADIVRNVNGTRRISKMDLIDYLAGKYEGA